MSSMDESVPDNDLYSDSISSLSIYMLQICFICIDAVIEL